MSFFGGEFLGGPFLGGESISGTFFGGDFFGGEFFTTEVEPPVVEAAPEGAGGGRPHRRRIPRYISVEAETEVIQEAVPAAQAVQPRIALRLPELTSFEAGILPPHIDITNNSGIRGKTVPNEWDEEDEWLLMH